VGGLWDFLQVDENRALWSGCFYLRDGVIGCILAALEPPAQLHSQGVQKQRSTMSISESCNSDNFVSPATGSCTAILPLESSSSRPTIVVCVKHTPFLSGPFANSEL